MAIDRTAARAALEALFTAEDNLASSQKREAEAVAQAAQNQAEAENAHQAAKQHLLATLGS
jgi:hypothetical protein